MGKYRDIGAEIGALVETKQAAYGDSFSKAGAILRILYPDGVPLEKLDDALTIVRILDKLFRIATDRDALGESPWRDIAGYALLSVARVEQDGGYVDETQVEFIKQQAEKQRVAEEAKRVAEAQMADLLKELTTAAKPKVAERWCVVPLEKCGDWCTNSRGETDIETSCVLQKGHTGPHEDRFYMQRNTPYDHDYGEW